MRFSRTRRIVLPLGAAVALGIAVVALGPRPPVDTQLEAVPLPGELSELPAWLAGRESSVAGVTSLATKRVVFADRAQPARTRWSVVYLHGFSATRQETAPLCDELGVALGANVFHTRLRGHGRDAEAMGEAEVGDWLQDGAEALAIGAALGERTLLVGCSTGATLALWLAAQPRFHELGGLVLISPNIRPRNPQARMLSWPWGEQLAEWVVGPYRSFEPHNEAQRAAWTTRYRTRALVVMAALLDLVADTDLGQVRAPTLTLYSPEDRVVDPAAIEARIPDLGSAVNVLERFEASRDPSQHVLAGEILSPESVAPLKARVLSIVAELP